jgi:cell division protein FtsL
VLAWVRALPDHRLLDRLIGGRIWIVLLGTLLVGIVTMQLSLLRLNAGIGRAVEQTSALQQSNAALRMEISQLSNSERIVGQATQMGFVMPPQGSPRFLSASSADAGKALTTMRVPDPSLAAASAAEVAATTPDPSATTDPTATSVDTASTDPTATTPTTTTDPTTAAPTTGTTAPATTGTTAPATGATTPVTPATPVAGGASAPQG